MAIQIVHQVKLRSQFRRISGVIFILLGRLLVLGGFIAACITTIVMILYLFLSAPGEALQTLFLGGLLSAVLLVLGSRLARGRRRLVLFLRRFGFSEASKMLSFAVTTAMGQRWRLVTLDDAEIAAIGSPKRIYRFLRVQRWVAIPFLIIGFYLFATLLINSDLSKSLEQAFKGEDNIIAGIFLAIIVFMLMLAMIVIIMTIAAMITVGGFASLGFWRAFQKVERAKVFQITDQAAVSRIISMVTAKAQSTFAPRLTVVRVNLAHWRQVVRMSAGEVAAVVVDVSQPTESLLWEIKTLQEEYRAKCMFVGHQDRVQQLTRETRQGTDAMRVQLQSLLDGEIVLSYKGEDRKAMQRFAKALGNRLENML